MSGLFDTGAEVTLADISMAENEKWIPAPYQNIPVTLDGTPLKIRGAVRTKVEFDGACVHDHLIYLVEGLGVSCLLGTDLMSRFPGVIVLDFEKKVATLGPKIPSHKGNCIVENPSPNLNYKCQGPMVGRVRLVAQAKIPAGHEVLLRASVGPELASSNKSCLLEPYPSLSRTEGLVGARALVHPCDSIVQVRFVNVSNRSISLKAGQAIASVEALDENPVVSSIMEDDGSLDVMSGRPTEVTGSEAQMIEDLVLGTEVQDRERSALRQNLQRNRDIFSLNGELGCTSMIEHRIHTTSDHPPIRQQPRRVPHNLLEVVDSQLDEMLDRGLIQESSSPWASPVVLVKKKNGDVRFCIDYRRLNSISHHDAFPVPRVDDALRSLGGAKWFSTLDLTSAYWQVPMDKESSRKAAFTTRRGLFEPKRMPFGLRSAPATMQRLMTTLFASMTWKMVLVYLDDIVIFSSTVDEHLKRMDLVFAKLREAKLKLKPSKCTLLRKSGISRACCERQWYFN